MSENKQLSDFAEGLGMFLGWIIVSPFILLVIGLKMLLTWGLVWLIKFIFGLIPGLFKLLFSFI